MKVKFLLCLRACTIIIAMTGLPAEAANTTTNYTWANSAGGSLTWTGVGSWTGGSPSTNSPGMSQSGTNYDEATISTISTGTATTITTPTTANGGLTFDGLTVNIPTGSAIP